MIPAQAVPWPTTSIASGILDDDRVLAAQVDPDAPDERAADGRMVALDPGVDDRDGHAGAVRAAERPVAVDARSTPSAAARRSAARWSVVNGSLQAGRISLGHGSAAPAAAAGAPLGVVGEHGQEVGHELELGGIGPAHPGDLLDERPQRRLLVALEPGGRAPATSSSTPAGVRTGQLGDDRRRAGRRRRARPGSR